MSGKSGMGVLEVSPLGLASSPLGAVAGDDKTESEVEEDVMTFLLCKLSHLNSIALLVDSTDITSTARRPFMRQHSQHQLRSH